VDWQTTITISKLDAAERQINTAVRLYFNDGDPVSIHTLSAAAFEILKDLDKKGPKTGTFYELVDQYVRPEERDTVMKTVKQAQNFFKHADQDPDATLDFILAEPEMFLLAACDKFRATKRDHHRRDCDLLDLVEHSKSGFALARGNKVVLNDPILGEF
jgi:hypothetical protein